LGPESEHTRITEGALTLLVIVLWVVTMGLGVVDLLVGRRLILEVAIALGANPWAHGAIDKFGFLILGIVWLIMIYLVEYYYRRAAELGLRKLLRRFFLVAGALISLAVVAVLVIFLIG
jgi:hypothetical protein